MRFVRRFAVVVVTAAAVALGWYAVRSFQPSVAHRETPERIARKFNELYYRVDVGHRTYWLGVQTLQTPTDMWAIQQILYEVRPDYIVETGTWHGGSALFHAMVLQQVNPEGRIITIDIHPQVEQANQNPLFRQTVEVWTGSSTSPQTLARLVPRVRGRRTLVLLDSNHAREHVAEELRLYGPLVSAGSYMIVHDTNLYGEGVPPETGPQEAVREFLATHPEFQVDDSREAMMLTFSSGGYLKKVRE